jgi:hypothetical protein
MALLGFFLVSLRIAVLSVTEFTIPGGAEGVSFPEDVYFNLDELVDLFPLGSFRN